MKVGIILTRAQPFHKGHIAVIKQILDENDKALVIIGSANKKDNTRNIFSINERLFFWNKICDSLIFTKEQLNKIDIMTLNDFSDDKNIPKQDNNTGLIDEAEKLNKEWGLYLYYNIVNKINEKTFNFYYNDNSNLIKAWFPEYLQGRINIIQGIRIDNLSSSRIRNNIKNKNINQLKTDLFYLNESEIKNLFFKGEN